LSRTRLHWIDADDPADAFPDPGNALRDPNGLVAAGGDLSPDRLLAAYRRGIFPWFSADQPVLWWSPDPRAVLLPEEFHASRSLRRRLRGGEYRVSIDQAFAEVIRLCASTREQDGTWITPAMIEAYTVLHARGLAHSVEVWSDGELAGGLYGINLGGVFFGESMVSLRSDASKVATARLAALARSERITLIDCQVPNDHLSSLGSRSMPRAEFLPRLRALVDEAPLERIRPAPAESTSALA
jgi:leucyl/phenylalanyl-tRNA---protein transferase